MPKIDFYVDFLALKVDFWDQKGYKKNSGCKFNSCACKLDFPELHESKFAAYFTGWYILEP